MAIVTSRAAESFVITGGRPLNGTIRAAGNKNGALPILAACLLTEEPVRLTNVPHIRDVETMVELIGDPACEPHIQDLCRFLVSLGAQIEGIGSNVLRIHGVDRLRGGEWRIGPEHIEVCSFIGLAAVTGGDVTIADVNAEDLAPILPAFDRLGVRVEMHGSSLRVPPGQELEIKDDLGGQIPKIEDGPWPAFPADLTSIALAVATQARGTILIFEKMFENRLFFVDKLVSMGARIILCDPHRAVVTGPARLFGQQMASPDIRAGMAMLIASLCAEGTSRIGNVQQIDRGYERIDERLRALGASIERIEA